MKIFEWQELFFFGKKNQTGNFKLYFLLIIQLYARITADLFERKLHIAVLVVVIGILSPVMHGKEIYETNGRIDLRMLGEVIYQRRDFQQFFERSVEEKRR